MENRITEGEASVKITRVVLADDHAVVRAGIRHLLRKAPDIAVVGEAINGDEALRMVEDLTPDVLLLDMEMPTISGIEVAQRLQETQSPVRILVLSAYEDSQYIQALLEGGASGYLTKDEVPEIIVEAVRGVSRGEEGWVSPRIAQKMSYWIHSDDDPQKKLNQVELRVLRLAAQKREKREIGKMLGIQESTVVRYLQSIFSKLGVSDIREAVAQAEEMGLL
jgi:DNA-binding NarL/FixJ family response regulator